ncbi:hypothetical protein LIER_24532 [Lithospermum erythrorhizon]|uniref:Uncharacterized protein n=1 Tax=Lithospermum erythrorhizon TaxID=34254 RepID=A0AAV3R4R6_LITER
MGSLTKDFVPLKTNDDIDAMLKWVPAVKSIDAELREIDEEEALKLEKEVNEKEVEVEVVQESEKDVEVEVVEEVEKEVTTDGDGLQGDNIWDFTLDPFESDVEDSNVDVEWIDTILTDQAGKT